MNNIYNMYLVCMCIHMSRKSLEALGTHIQRAERGRGAGNCCKKSQKNIAPGRRQNVVGILRKAAPGSGHRERQDPFDAPTSQQEAQKEQAPVD